MFRQSITKAARPTATTLRSFATSLRVMAGGDTGAPRNSGQGDAFTKREKANEDFAIRKREMDKLQELKKKLEDQHESLNKLKKHIDELSKESGGEQN